MGTLFKSILFLGFVLTSSYTYSSPKGTDERPLAIKGLGPRVTQFKRSDFFRHKHIQIIKIAKDPAYGKEQSYLAVPFKVLLGDVEVNTEATIEFECFDGYSAVLDVNELLNVDDAHQPYVAFALADGSSLPKSHEGKEVGPYYLVWPSPKDGVYKEANWPFNLSGFNFINKSFAEQFPNVFPTKWSASEVENLNLREGLKLFRTNCFVCHKMNGEGNAKMGVDLKQSGIVKGFDDSMLKQFVRNPKALMPKTKMSAFSSEMLSDADLEKILFYLRYMQAQGE